MLERAGVMLDAEPRAAVVAATRTYREKNRDVMMQAAREKWDAERRRDVLVQSHADFQATVSRIRGVTPDDAEKIAKTLGGYPGMGFPPR